jgi:hypothetical protein
MTRRKRAAAMSGADRKASKATKQENASNETRSQTQKEHCFTRLIRLLGLPIGQEPKNAQEASSKTTSAINLTNRRDVFNAMAAAQNPHQLQRRIVSSPKSCET